MDQRMRRHGWKLGSRCCDFLHTDLTDLTEANWEGIGPRSAAANLTDESGRMYEKRCLDDRETHACHTRSLVLCLLYVFYPLGSDGGWSTIGTL